MLRQSLASVVCLVWASSSFGAVASTFDSGYDGWMFTGVANLGADNLFPAMGNYTSTHNATGGNPGGFISMTDTGAGDQMFTAPAAFRGNQFDAYGLTLKYDLIYTGTVDYQTTDVLLTGPGSASGFFYKPSTPFVPTGTWQTRTVPLVANSDWHMESSTGPQPTAAQFQTLLAGLTGLYIRAEYTNGSGEVVGLDNVVLAPEPAGLTLLLAAALPLCRRSRSRTR